MAYLYFIDYLFKDLSITRCYQEGSVRLTTSPVPPCRCMTNAYGQRNSWFYTGHIDAIACLSLEIPVSLIVHNGAYMQRLQALLPNRPLYVFIVNLLVLCVHHRNLSKQ